MRRLVVMFGLLATGCTTPSAPLDYQAEREAYAECNLSRSMDVAFQSADPLSLAISVEAMCGAEQAALMRRLNSLRGPAFALRTMNMIEENQIRMNAAFIVKARS